MTKNEEMFVNTKCQVFTPRKNVEELLDAISYIDNLYGKKVAENSCGDGNILAGIVERYIVDCLKNNISLLNIKKGLEKDIWGAEIDNNHIVNCLEKLDTIAIAYGLEDISWNIYNGDFLKENILEAFDFVIGNPPYITYQELNQNDREFLRNSFFTCKNGKFDYCYAFIEASLKSLNNKGKMAYLIPSNIFKNQFGLNLRKYILPYLTDIYDYAHQKLFSGKLTASAIIVCDLENQHDYITYHDITKNKRKKIHKKTLVDKWIFEKSRINSRLENTIRFGDYFHAASSIATLLNEAYILSNFEESDTYVHIGEKRIEKNLLKKAVSPRSINRMQKEYVIFPYYYNECGLQKYSEKEFRENFPFALEYLKKFEKKLSQRKSDNGIRWFEYGRSQALAHLNQKKLLISTLITKTVKIASLDEDTIPTSGLYIVVKEGPHQYDLSKAESILKSDLFFEYVKRIGVVSNGKSFRISSRDINDFTFPTSLLK